MSIEGEHVTGPTHLSKSTLERTAKFVRNAKAANLDTGDACFPDKYDYVVFFMTNGINTIMVYCTPTGYLAEYYKEVSIKLAEDTGFDITYIGIRNIRHLVFKLAKLGYGSWTKYNQDIIEAIDKGEIDIEDYLDTEDE